MQHINIPEKGNNAAQGPTGKSKCCITWTYQKTKYFSRWTYQKNQIMQQVDLAEELNYAA